MEVEIIILQGAEADLIENMMLLESRTEGAGLVFTNAIDEGLSQLKGHPESAPVKHPPFRRLLLASLPFGIFYEVAGRRVIIHAILDLRQNPEFILKRLFDR